MQKIAILTSGGDAPGMNAAIRAAVRACCARGLQAVGVRRGYNGLMENEMQALGARDVANILQRGGTMLLTARSKAFMQAEGRAQAAANLRAAGVGGLIVIGGDGSFRGATALSEEHGIPVIGLPGTIDTAIWGTDHSIGYFTAVETAVDAVDKLRDTGASHDPEHGPRHIRTFRVGADGRTLGRSKVFATCTAGLFDGFRLDAEGRIWTSAADGVHIYHPDGTLIGKVAIPEIVANVCWGGPKLNRLFICGTTSLYSVMTHTNGAARPA